MKNKIIKVKKINLGNNLPLTLIAGPCQIESKDHCHMIASKIKDITSKLNIGFIFKSSFDKANRTSIKSKRGVGLDKSLSIFDYISKDLDVPILTDVHNEEQCRIVSKVVDIIQIPAFLCRQTDLLVAAAKTNKVVNVKKGQFLAPWDMKNVIKKIEESGFSKFKNVKKSSVFFFIDVLASTLAATASIYASPMQNNPQNITDTTVNAMACGTTFAAVQQTTRALLQKAYNAMTCERGNSRI